MKQLALLDYQRHFIDFLVRSGALTFGDFVTKSGRKTPYFVNTGNFNDGAKITELGKFYAAHIMQSGLNTSTIIFGPAYKGIPLCVTTSAALFSEFKLNVGFSFDRKEVKDHGDGGKVVGQKIKDGDKVVIVEDVITAGTTLREVVPFLNSIAKVQLNGVVIAVDRCEKGSGTLSAVQEAQESMGVKVFPIVTIHHIVQYLSAPNGSSLTLDQNLQQRIAAYLETYGA
ncbi:MAG: orotate phosphoribosyltransferase [Deltaproteobacteria bacterium]|nr:orotate phosphoribosyltransferase [Deltaproteobacteria bacterium]